MGWNSIEIDFLCGFTVSLNRGITSWDHVNRFGGGHLGRTYCLTEINIPQIVRNDEKTIWDTHGGNECRLALKSAKKLLFFRHFEQFFIRFDFYSIQNFFLSNRPKKKKIRNNKRENLPQNLLKMKKKLFCNNFRGCDAECSTSGIHPWVGHLTDKPSRMP